MNKKFQDVPHLKLKCILGIIFKGTVYSRAKFNEKVTVYMGQSIQEWTK